MKEKVQTGFQTRAAKTSTNGLSRNRPLNIPIEPTTDFQVASSAELRGLFLNRASEPS